MEVFESPTDIQRDTVLSLQSAPLMTYKAYRDLIDKNHLENKVTGHEQSQELLQYSQLNAQRMTRWDKHYIPSEAIQDTLPQLPANWHVVVIAEGWCGDAAQIIPAIQKIASLGRDWKFSIALRDENPIWMNLFLTNGAKAIPIAVVFDAMGHYIFHWGPRPKLAIELINNAKSMLVPAEVWKVELHKWYATNKQQALELEWMELLTKYKTT